MDSDGSQELLQQKIDSLTHSMEKNATDANLAEFYHDLGNKWYFNIWWEKREKADMEKALLFTERALKIKRNQKGLEEGSLEKTLFNLAYFNYHNDKLYKAIEHYTQLIRNTDHSLKRDAIFELGLCYSIAGEFFKALERFDDFIGFSKEKNIRSDGDKLYLAEAYIRKAETYSRMGYRENSDSIKSNLTIADSIVQEISGDTKFYQNLIDQIEGNRLLKTKNYNDAVGHFNEILKDSASLITIDKAIVYNSLGKSYLELKDYDAAYGALQKSISANPNYSYPNRNLGDYSIEIQNFEEAMKHYQKAINLAIDRNSTNTYNKLPTVGELKFTTEKIALLDHIIAKANGWIKYYEHDKNLNHLEEALETFDLADALVDVIRFENTEDQSKLFWREKGSQLYAKAVETCFLLNRPQDAFYYLERNKALLLLEDLSNEEAKQVANLPIEMAQQEFELKRAIFLSENNLQNQRERLAQDSLTLLKNEIRDRKYNYEIFIDSLEISYPDYAKSKMKVDLLSYEEVKTNYISTHTATLHYILNEEEGYGLLTTSDTTALFKLDSVALLNQEVELLLENLSDGLSGMNNFRTLSNSIFQKLFPETVYGQIKGKQLTVIPDYTLQQIPFESLVVDSTKLNYLFQEVEIGYAYSASLLYRKQGEPKDFHVNFLGVAPIDFDSLKLPELYFSENEVKSIAGVFPGETLFNGQASKNNFVKSTGNHNIIHLATHADLGDGDNPWIAFGDAKMYLKEIYATKTNADMVVLSGCNTSNGELKRGEGVMSLARGFFYSGAKSVVSTLWPVSDEAGKDILINFYKNLHKGLSKSKALQQAKLDYLSETEEEELKHPYYWAGFVVLGNNSPLSNKPVSPWSLTLLGILGAGILILGYKKIKSRQSQRAA